MLFHHHPIAVNFPVLVETRPHHAIDTSAVGTTNARSMGLNRNLCDCGPCGGAYGIMLGLHLAWCRIQTVAPACRYVDPPNNDEKGLELVQILEFEKSFKSWGLIFQAERMAEGLKTVDCKSISWSFVGSNPTPFFN